MCFGSLHCSSAYCLYDTRSEHTPVNNAFRNLIKNGPRARRGKAVQRAPSRLYRTVGGPTRCFNKAQCVGPEFVVRANQPPKTLCVGQVKVTKLSLPSYINTHLT